MKILEILSIGLMVTTLAACTAEGELDDPDNRPETPDVGFDSGSQNSRDTDAGHDASAGDGGDGGTTICDPLAPACPTGQKCVPGVSSNGSTGQSTCIPRGTENEIGADCSRTTDCVEGAACVADDGETLCRELCDPSDIESCMAGTLCTKTLGSDSSVGVCAPQPQACDIYAQDCDSGACVLLRHPLDGEVAPYCGDAGSVATGEPCGDGAGECVAGTICLQAGGDAQPVCHAVCRTPDTPCAQGACTGTSAAGVDFCL